MKKRIEKVLEWTKGRGGRLYHLILTKNKNIKPNKR